MKKKKKIKLLESRIKILVEQRDYFMSAYTELINKMTSVIEKPDYSNIELFGQINEHNEEVLRGSEKWF